ncbi:hypothetical protein GE09DRAFT_255128 [Coniochaeta sp. 2T2.1]|nr:hypothetical protein GE09DRAFT_255128 [Coniochaeta sp. 2T2.1]
MAESQPRQRQRHLDATQGREVVYCHACQNEWFRDEQPGLECPRCHGDIIEIISPDSDPRDLNDGPDVNFATRPPGFDNYHDHDSDPEEADIDEHIHQGPHGFFMHRTVRPGGLANHDDDEMAVLRRFTDMINRDFHGGPPPPGGPVPLFPQMPGGDAGHPDTPRQASPGPAFARTTVRTFPFGSARVTVSTIGGVPGGRGGPLDFDAVFGNLMGGPPGANDPNNPHTQQGQPPPFAASLGGLIALFLGQPPGGVHGDAVYSQEALDRIITQLMEQNPHGSNAAPPASEDAISKLSKRNVTIEDLGSDGRAECTICIDELKVGDEVTVLPCKHWFHGECVTLWLKEHNTCPICRTPIEANSNRGNARRDQQQHGQEQGGQQGEQQGQRSGQPQSNNSAPQSQPPLRLSDQWQNNPNMPRMTPAEAREAWYNPDGFNQFQERQRQQQQQQQPTSQDPAPSSSSSSSRSRYDRLFRNGEDRLNSIRNLGGRPSPQSSSSQPPQQSGIAQRRSSHSPAPEPENRTPRIRSPEFRSRDPFEEQGQQQQQTMSGYNGRRESARSENSSREGQGERSSGPLSWIRDQFNRHAGAGSGNGGNGSGSGSGNGAGDRRLS